MTHIGEDFGGKQKRIQNIGGENVVGVSNRVSDI